MLVLAQATPDSLAEWLQWGVLGLVIVAFLIGQLIPGYLYQQMKAERDQLQEKNDELTERLLEMQEQVVPALIASTDAVSAASTEMQRQAIIRDHADRVEGLG